MAIELKKDTKMVNFMYVGRTGLIKHAEAAVRRGSLK